MGIKLSLAGAAATIAALKAYQIEAKRQGWADPISTKDYVILGLCGAALGLGAQEIMQLLRKAKE